MKQNNVKNNKIVLITGSARRLGKAIALQLHSQDIDVIVHCNNSLKEADKLVSDMNSKRDNSAISIKYDLRDFSDYEKIISELGEKWSNIDVLINNASTFYPTDVSSSTTDDWDDLHDVNLKAPFFLSKIFYKNLKKNNGCIINIVDILINLIPQAESPLSQLLT